MFGHEVMQKNLHHIRTKFVDRYQFFHAPKHELIFFSDLDHVKSRGFYCKTFLQDQGATTGDKTEEENVSVVTIFTRMTMSHLSFLHSLIQICVILQT